MNYVSLSIWSQGISAFLFLVALIAIWMKYIQPAIIVAQAAQNEQIAQAERHRDEAKAGLEALQGEIAAAQRDASAIKERILGLAASERESTLREAREAGERALRNAQGEHERAAAAANRRFRDDLLRQALQIARRQAKAQVDAGADRQLLSTFFATLEHGERG